MSDSLYGYRQGRRAVRPVRLDSATAAIEVGDMLTLGTAGYFQQAAAGDIPICVAMEKSAAPSADGDLSILADFDLTTVYEYPPDAGSVTVALIGKTCDVGGPKSVNIDATVDDVLLIVDVDTDANTAFVMIRPTYAGV